MVPATWGIHNGINWSLISGGGAAFNNAGKIWNRVRLPSNGAREREQMSRKKGEFYTKSSTGCKMNQHKS